MSQISDISQLSELSDLVTEGESTYTDFKFMLLNCLCIAIGNIFIGYNSANFNALNTKTLKTLFHINLDDSKAAGVIFGVYSMGGCIGSITTELLLIKLTRRRNVLRLTALAGVSSVVVTLITTFEALLIARFMCGFCTGIYMNICPIYIKQLAPIEISGNLGVLAQLCTHFGRVMGLFISLPFLSEKNQSSPVAFWWIPLAFPLLFLVPQLLLLGRVYVRQTPKYHLIHRQDQKALSLIKQIYKPKYVWDVFYRIFRDVQSQRKRKARHQKSNRLTIVVAIVISLSLSPPWIILVGGKKMLVEDLGPQKANYIYIGIKSLSIVTVILAIYMDTASFSRRGIILFGQISAVVLLFSIGVCSQSIFRETESRTAFVLVIMVLFNLTWGLTVVPVAWVYIAQILQPRLIPLVSFANLLQEAVVTYLYPVGTTWLDLSWVYMLCGCWNLILTVFSYFFLIQSKGKSEVQISHEFNKLKEEEF